MTMLDWIGVIFVITVSYMTMRWSLLELQVLEYELDHLDKEEAWAPW